MALTLDPDAIGPVDIAVFAFEGDAFNGKIAPALADLVGAGTIRIIDLAFIRKGADGDVEFVEVVDADLEEAFAGFADDPLDLLNDEDLLLLADGLDPATAAMVVVWENTWAAEAAAAIRNSGGFLVNLERVPHPIVTAALEALAEG